VVRGCGVRPVSENLRPFRSGAAVVDRSDASILQFTGPQARWFLDQLLTNRVLDLPTGSGADAMLLTPKGRITAVLRLWASGDEQIIAVLDPGMAAMLEPFFAGRVFATRVTVEDRSAEVALVCVLGPHAGAVAGRALGRLGSGAPPALPGDEEHANVTVAAGDASVLVARVVRPVRGLDLLVGRDRLPAVVEALVAEGAEVRTPADLGVVSVVEGLPRYGIDFGDQRLPQEAALERAVHFAKGCYLGQEAVAMAQRGRVKRRLRHLAFEGPAATGPVVHEGLPVGEVTSVAEEDGRGWGIATVLTSVAPGSVVEVVETEAGEAAAAQGLRAEVRELPGTQEGPRAPSARELRERLAGGPRAPGSRPSGGAAGNRG
jgi:folate-binding protein YgfZ